MIVRSGFQSPRSCTCDTMRVPGFSLHELRPQLHVDVRPQEQRHHGRRREVGLEQVALDEPHAVGDVRALRVLVGFRDALRIDVDADAARTEVLRRRDHDPAVAGAQVVDDVARR